MRRSLLMSMLAMGMCMASSSPYSLRKDPSGEGSADHSKNIKPYHSKPAKKGAMQKKLSKKQRKQINQK